MAQPQQLQKVDTDYVDLRMLLHTIIEKKWIVLAISLLTFLIAITYITFKPTTYQASVLLEVHHKQENSLGSIHYGQHEDANSLTEEPISVQIALIRSKFILEPVIRSLNLAVDSEIINQIRSHLIITDLSYSAENPLKKAGILQLTLTGRDADKTMKIINKIALITQLKDKERKAHEAKKTLEFFYQQLPIIQTSLKEAEAKLNHYRSTSGKIDIKLQTQYLLTHLSDIDKQLEIIRFRKMEMSQQYTSYHPFIITLNQKQNELERQRSGILNQVKKLPAADQVASNLARDVDVKNTLYMMLLNKIHEQQVITAGIVSDIGILSLATFPDKPLLPKLPIVMCSSLLIGLILGCLGVLLWQMFTLRVSHPHWAEQKFNLENLIILPFSKKQAAHSLAFKANKSKFLPLLVHESPHDLAIESLRFLHTILQVNTKKSHNNILTMMSISNSVGKTFITANFAGLLAAMNNKILLIDADIRHGHMHHYFTAKSTPGLTDILNNEATIEEALIQSPQFSKLDFLPTGAKPENPTELLMSNNFKSLLSELSKEYQYVIINTSPILSLTDGAFIGSIAGTNLLVLGANRHESWEINIAIKNLRNAGVKLDGSIFNSLKPSKVNHYYKSSPIISSH